MVFGRDEYGADEYSQFQVVNNMTTVGTSAIETLKNLLFYNYYFYGYPFFVTSTLSILPAKAVEHYAGTFDSPTLYLVILRQLSPLFNLISILVLVYLWTGFKSTARSLLLFGFLAALPGVFRNNMWWHPDALLAIFVCLTLFALATDELRFGPWFYLGAVACGVAVGVKVLGVFFFLTVATYLALGLIRRRITFRESLRHASLFIAVMIVTIVLTNPLLVIPSVAKEYAAAQQKIAARNAVPDDIGAPTGPSGWYAVTLKTSFGFWWMYVIALSACLMGILADRRKQLLNILILTWVIPLSVYLVFFVAHTRGSRYFIPVFLPLMSCIGNGWWSGLASRSGPRRMVGLGILGAAILLCGIQFVHYAIADGRMYVSALHRERDSPAIRFYRLLDDSYLSKLPHERRLVIFRDPHVYVPPSSNLDVHFKWGTADYGDISRIRPQLVLLEKEMIERYADPAAMSTLGAARASYEFYRDVKVGSVRGFHRILETDFGIAFAEDSLPTVPLR
jgi:hypothetical protein